MKRFNSVSAICLALVVCSSCAIGDDPLDGETDSFNQKLVVPSAEVAMILALVNNPDTDIAFLDYVVALNELAAIHIVEYRRGADQLDGSLDDRRFDSLEELDHVAYVGPFALKRLHEFVLANPLPDIELVEGVEFTADEAATVVWGINTASLFELDIEVGLEARAAKNLTALGPFQSVTEISEVPYVGPFALRTLRGYVDVWDADKDGQVD